MWLIDQIAEQRILDAINDGQFDDLTGMGLPLPMEDNSLVPEELRVSYRILKNAGFLPPEMQLRGDIATVDTLINQACHVEDRAQLSRRRNFLLMQLGLSNSNSALLMEEGYRRKLIGQT